MFGGGLMGIAEEPVELVDSTRRWMWAGLVLMALFVVAFPIYRIYEPGQRAEARENQLGFLAAHGEDLFTSDCASCHGPLGRGGLGPAIGSTDFLESVNDDQIAQLISVGVPGTEMVSYSLDHGGPLTSQEIRAITVYLRSLEEEAEPNPLWHTPLAADDLSGETLFTMACARCHGADRKGIEDVGPDISSTSLTMTETDEFLIGRIKEGRMLMPRFDGVLTDDQIVLLVAFLRGVDPTMVTTTTEPPAGDDTTPTTAPDETDSEVLALGKEVFDVTAGGEGCAACHGFDGRGTSEGPNIIGVSKSSITSALGGGVPDMADFGLTQEQIEAVYQYVRTLSG
jgi:cbb3-type cytochrome c oxidase subunit III